MLLKVRSVSVPDRFKTGLEPLDSVTVRPIYLTGLSDYGSQFM